MDGPSQQADLPAYLLPDERIVWTGALGGPFAVAAGSDGFRMTVMPVAVRTDG